MHLLASALVRRWPRSLATPAVPFHSTTRALNSSAMAPPLLHHAATALLGRPHRRASLLPPSNSPSTCLRSLSVSAAVTSPRSVALTSFSQLQHSTLLTSRFDTTSPHPRSRAASSLSLAAALTDSTSSAPDTGRTSSNAPPAASSAAAAPTDQLGLDDLIVTAAARRRLAALRADAVAAGRSGAASLSLRIRVDGGGCSGFRYAYLLQAGEREPDDVVFSRAADGVPVVVDAVSLGLIRGATLDWIDEMMRNTFAVVNNPQSDSSCGCGSSFSAKG